MSSQPRDIDPLLADLLAGDLDEHDSTVQERFAAEPELAARWHELQQVVGVLEDSGQLKDDILAEARTEQDAPGLDRLDSLRRRWQSASTDLLLTRPEPRRWPSLAIGGLIAAAILLAAVAYWLAQQTDSDGDRQQRREERTIGGGFRALKPEGALASFETFSWETPAQPGSQFRVIVQDAESRQEIDRSLDLEQPLWQPDEEKRASWPPRIRWQVEVWTEGIRVARSPWISASR